MNDQDWKVEEFIEEIVKQISNRKEARKIVYTNDGIKELLGIGDKTLKKWRDNGILGYSRVGDKYFYSEADIHLFLESNHFDAYQTNSITW